jgi:hypothetical protein
MMEQIVGVLFFVVMAAFAVASIVWHFGRSRDVLQKWADDNGFQIIESRYAHWKGPFMWTSSKGQSVYRVTVRDRNGYTRSGWVRCGSWWLGLWSDSAQVRWDD